MTLALALTLGSMVILVEAFRKKGESRLDILLGIHIVFFICFCIIPASLSLLDFSDIEGWDWAFVMSFDNPAFPYALFISGVGYIYILIGYVLKPTGHIGEMRAPLEWHNKELMTLASVFFIIGALSFFIYVKSIGGIWISIKYANAFRGKYPPVVSKWAFLKKIAPLVIASSYLYFALIKERLGKLMFPLAFLLSLYLLFHQAGRLSLASYLLVFPLAKVIEGKKLHIRFIVLALILSVTFLTVGDSLFTMFLHGNPLKDAMPGKGILMEFSFPYITLAHATKAAGTEIPLRLFLDIAVAVFYLIPQRVVPINLPVTLSELNSLHFHSYGTIPVDLFSLGYYSLGLGGVMLICLLFGALIRALERVFPAGNGPVSSVFRSAWILNASFMIMYGDPEQWVKGDFALIITTLVLVWMAKRFPARHKISSKG